MLPCLPVIRFIFWIIECQRVGVGEPADASFRFSFVFGSGSTDEFVSRLTVGTGTLYFGDGFSSLLEGYIGPNVIAYFFFDAALVLRLDDRLLPFSCTCLDLDVRFSLRNDLDVGVWEVFGECVCCCVCSDRRVLDFLMYNIPLIVVHTYQKLPGLLGAGAATVDRLHTGIAEVHTKLTAVDLRLIRGLEEFLLSRVVGKDGGAINALKRPANSALTLVGKR